MSPLDRRALRTGSVPGWVIDRVCGVAGGCVVVAARAARPSEPTSPARYATIALAAADDVAAHETLAHLASLAREADTAVLDVIVGCREAIAMVLPPTLGLADAERTAATDAVVVPPPPRTPPRPPAPAAVAGPPSVDAPPAGRRVVGALAAVAGIVAMLLGARVWIEGGPSGAAAASTTHVEWDAAAATATVHSDAGPRRFVLGAPGDQLVIGDWDGDGRSSPALYRPSTGDVWTFDAWAEGGAPATARWAARHVTGGHAEVVATPHGDEIAVRAT